MAKQSIIILTSTTNHLNVTGSAIKAAGYYGYSLGLHTISWKLKDFIGRVFVEGSLVSNPTENDWFPIFLSGQNAYTQYPIDPDFPSGLNGGDSGVDAYTFQANLVWLRIRIDRSYLTNPNVNMVGSIENALLNY